VVSKALEAGEADPDELRACLDEINSVLTTLPPDVVDEAVSDDEDSSDDDGFEEGGEEEGEGVEEGKDGEDEDGDDDDEVLP
jgi:hypothetical protein